LTEKAIRSLLGTQFTAFSAKAFQASGWNGTFVAFNDATAGFQANSDSVVYLANYNLPLASYPIQLA
jgi:hypothetical protein